MQRQSVQAFIKTLPNQRNIIWDMIWNITLQRKRKKTTTQDETTHETNTKWLYSWIAHQFPWLENVPSNTNVDLHIIPELEVTFFWKKGLF